MRYKLIVITTAGFTILFTWGALATTIRVPADQPTIQAGIDWAVPGDTVLVADGTYSGDGNRDIDFGGKNVVLMSENGPEVTTIDCQGSLSEQHRAFWLHSGEDSTAIIAGFTMTGGFAFPGGAVWCQDGSSPKFTGCNLIANSSTGVPY